MGTRGVLLDKALGSVGGKEEFERKSRQYSESVHFIDAGRKELLKEYDGNWIAVYESNVVAHGRKYDDVVKTIRQKGLPIEEIALKFLSSRRMMTLF